MPLTVHYGRDVPTGLFVDVERTFRAFSCVAHVETIVNLDHIRVLVYIKPNTVREERYAIYDAQWEIMGRWPDEGLAFALRLEGQE